MDALEALDAVAVAADPMIIYAAKRSDVARLRQVLAAGASPNEFDLNGNGGTSLHCVCTYGTPARSPTGRYPEDAVRDWVECVRILLAAGADPNLRDSHNDTVLHDLVQNDIAEDCGKKVQIANMLLAAGADVTAIGSCSCTPLHVAAALSDADTVELLLRAKGASTVVNLGDHTEETPLVAAAGQRNRRVYPLLLSAGADLPAQADDPYLRAVIAAGGFAKYANQHLAAVTALFVRTDRPRLPPEMVRHVLRYWLHAGCYVY